MICISSDNDRHLVTKTFTPLHYTCRHFAYSHLNFTQLHFTTLHCPLIWINPIQIPYRFISPLITMLHLTSLQLFFVCTEGLLYILVCNKEVTQCLCIFHTTPMISCCLCIGQCLRMSNTVIEQ
jgi:hypothetical protein